MVGVSTASAQSSPAQPSVPIRQVAPILAKTRDTLGTIFGVRHLHGGRALVNDPQKHRVMLFDSTLTAYTIPIDSVSGARNSYGMRYTTIVPYVADSTLFVDYASQSLIVIDPKGEIAHVMSPPKPSDLNWLTSGSAGTDATGRLVYRSYDRIAPTPTAANQTVFTSQSPDSMPIVRADFDARSVDTIGRVRTSPGRTTTTRPASGGMPTSFKMTLFPIATIDEWAITTDGSIAFLSGSDYHVDWLQPDGSKLTSPKLPLDWRRLPDEEKRAALDSARHYRDSLAALPNAPVAMRVCYAEGNCQSYPFAYENAALSELPDYYPPFRQGGLLADRDNNLWILPFTSTLAGRKGLVYDVVNRKGELAERVQIPEGRSIVGFGPGGIVYLQSGDLKSGFVLERTRVVR